jgi:hypothetical protein
MSDNYRVEFRLIQTPCCSTLLCWVNPRIPNYCPECGKHIFRELKFNGALPDPRPGWLKVSDARK